MDLQECIERLHKPRMAKLAEMILKESDYSYEYFEPPAFETYMIQLKLQDDLIVCINYFPIELSDDAPYLFLQFHCVLGELEIASPGELQTAVIETNNAIELSHFGVNDSLLFHKSVWIDRPEQELDLRQIGFLLRVHCNNLLAHRDRLSKLSTRG